HSPALPGALAGKAGITLTTLDDALSKAQIIALLVDHQAFKDIDRARLNGKAVIDTRGIWR
ncbi:MAG: UDP-N-acetyl-D-mannosamine dehydrogenase, partial [Rhodospirillales bacterium]|nr:UDP-N-acetyl-D-mannosamine dehydrogenase [Rhodospirillales bacterium]